MTTGRWLALITLGLVLGVFVVIQFVPYRVTNPPVRQEPTWDSPRTEALVRAACYDCHSNESDPYFFERVAPVSWLVTRDVRAGREELNFSECRSRPEHGDDDPGETVREREMPPKLYTLLGLHPSARLDRGERADLAAGLDRSLRDWDCEPD